MKIGILTAGKSSELVKKYLLEEYLSGWEITFYDDTIPEYKGVFEADEDFLIIATGIMWLRRKLYEHYKGRTFINVFYGSCPIDVGQGNIIFQNVLFEPFSKIGHNNIISSGTIINHHCTIGDSNLFGPGCLLSGSITIGNNCDIGSGVIFEPGVTVADFTTIPSGAIIVGDVSGHVKAKRRGSIFTGEYSHKTDDLLIGTEDFY